MCRAARARGCKRHRCSSLPRAARTFKSSRELLKLGSNHRAVCTGHTRLIRELFADRIWEKRSCLRRVLTSAPPGFLHSEALYREIGSLRVSEAADLGFGGGGPRESLWRAARFSQCHVAWLSRVSHGFIGPLREKPKGGHATMTHGILDTSGESAATWAQEARPEVKPLTELYPFPYIR